MGSEFDVTREQARQRLASLERLETLLRLRDEAESNKRTAMLKSIEDLIAMERRALARDMDGEPA